MGMKRRMEDFFNLRVKGLQCINDPECGAHQISPWDNQDESGGETTHRWYRCKERASEWTRTPTRPDGIPGQRPNTMQFEIAGDIHFKVYACDSKTFEFNGINEQAACCAST